MVSNCFSIPDAEQGRVRRWQLCYPQDSALSHVPVRMLLTAFQITSKKSVHTQAYLLQH